MLRLLTLLSAICIAMTASAKQDPIWFVFLVRGEAKAPADKVDAMQAAHIGNFKRLFAEHKLLAAGPLKDPTEFRRGIVVLRAKGGEAVRQCFNTDPYVQAGIMHLEVYRWNADPKRISLKTIDPNAIEENRIVLLMGPEKPDDHAKWPHVAKHSEGRIGGVFQGVGEIKEVRLFRGTDGEEKIKRELEADPRIKRGEVRYRILPLWMAKGTLG